MDTCVFCKIRDREIKTEIEYESDTVIAFRDKNPASEVHILIVPKEHIPTFLDIDREHKEIMSDVFEATQKLIKDKNVDSRYRVSFNGGSLQVVQHLHLHLLGGEWIKNKHDF